MFDSNKIFSKLKELYDICENHGAIVFALTIMEMEFTYVVSNDYVFLDYLFILIIYYFNLLY